MAKCKSKYKQSPLFHHLPCWSQRYVFSRNDVTRQDKSCRVEPNGIGLITPHALGGALGPCERKCFQKAPESGFSDVRDASKLRLFHADGPAAVLSKLFLINSMFTRGKRQFRTKI